MLQFLLPAHKSMPQRRVRVWSIGPRCGKRYISIIAARYYFENALRWLIALAKDCAYLAKACAASIREISHSEPQINHHTGPGPAYLHNSPTVMNYRPRWTKCTLIFGGTAVWGLLLISCVMTDRTVVAPPFIEGAKFVGSQECAQCHENLTSKFHTATHAKLAAEGGNAEAIGCEACHGAGSIHVKSGGGAGTIINPGSSPETCYQCHLDKRAEFNLPNTHPVAAGRMSCSDCHNAHTGDAITEGGTEVQVAQIAKREGMMTLTETAIDLVNKGITSLEEAMSIIMAE